MPRQCRLVGAPIKARARGRPQTSGWGRRTERSPVTGRARDARTGRALAAAARVKIGRVTTKKRALPFANIIRALSSRDSPDSTCLVICSTASRSCAHGMASSHSAPSHIRLATQSKLCILDLSNSSMLLPRFQRGLHALEPRTVGHLLLSFASVNKTPGVSPGSSVDRTGSSGA